MFLAHVRSLRLVLADPRVRQVAASSLVARLPKGMLPLATVLLLHQVTGSYALAGLAAALLAIGDAATTPLQGRLIDRYGLKRVLPPIAALHVVAVVSLIFLTAWPLALAVSAAAAGIGMPPVSGSVKAVWPRLVDRQRLPAAYVLESLLQQVLFLAGPLLVTLVVVAASPLVALLSAAFLVLAGTIWFVVAAPEPVAGGRSRQAGVLWLPAVRVLTASAFLQGMAFGAEPVGLSAFAGAAGAVQLAGVVQAMLTFGGILGTFAPLGADGERTYVRMLSWFSVALTPVAFFAVYPANVTLFATGVVLVGAGLFLTPIAAASYLLVGKATPGAEAFAWLSTGLAAGSATGSAVAGLLADRFGAVVTLALMPVAVALAAFIAHRMFAKRSR
ncbi:MFS transporter [Fodinicola acaciae]|uniref:MFS transporter n=1 Tax=Fodinicola acaciae TaxID=2681555 RepID=UPI0031B61A51